MHQSFLTSDTLYCMMFDGSRPRPGQANAEAVQREMEEKLMRWAALVSACAPGTGTVLLPTALLCAVLCRTELYCTELKVRALLLH
jgi:hypothetical protein